jgi:hypothetical protein
MIVRVEQYSIVRLNGLKEEARVPSNALGFTDPALIDRESNQAETRFQKSSDLARRVAASAAMAFSVAAVSYTSAML